MAYNDEIIEDELPDETDIEPDRSFIDSVLDKLHPDDDAGADDGDPPHDVSLWL